MIVFTFRVIRKLIHLLYTQYSQTIARTKLIGNGVKFGKRHTYRGIPYINISPKGFCTVGNMFSCNSGDANPIGRNSKSYLYVGPGALLKIGDHVGISNTAINCYKHIEIEDFVKMGGGVVVYDTDFHSLDYLARSNKEEDSLKKSSSPVKIKRHAFIGAHSTILKGVTVGERAIIGACSVVTKDVPDDEIWAGNPARFVRKINNTRLGN